MNEELVKYIRKHDYIYYFLRDDSSYYKYLYYDNKNIKYIKKLAKEKYKLRFIDKLEKISSGIEQINTIIDVLK